MVGWCFNAADTNRQIWVCFEIHFAVVQYFDQEWTTIIYLMWRGCTGQNQMGWVHLHPNSVLEYCVCLLQLFCPCGWGKKSFCCWWCTHTKNKILIRNEQQNILFERVAQDNTRWVGCTNIHIVYYDIVFASYNFSAFVVAKWYVFCWCGRYTNNMIF